MKTIKNSPKAKPSAYRQLEEVVGCKWSVAVLKAVANGISRPGELERYVKGISKKVLSERLRKLTVYGLLCKQVYTEVPPRTEYSLTENARHLISIIDQIRTLDDQIKTSKTSDGKI